MPGFFCVYGCGRGTPEEGGIARWMQSGMLLRFCEKDGEGRRRKVALVRGGCCWDFVRRMYRGTPGEEGIAPGVDAVVDVFEILRGGCG